MERGRREGRGAGSENPMARKRDRVQRCRAMRFRTTYRWPTDYLGKGKHSTGYKSFDLGGPNSFRDICKIVIVLQIEARMQDK